MWKVHSGLLACPSLGLKKYGKHSGKKQLKRHKALA